MSNSHTSTIAVVLLAVRMLSAADAPQGAPSPRSDASLTNWVSVTMQASPLESSNVLRSFVGRGIVRDLPPEGHSVVVRHDAIQGFMPSMTMEFNVRDTNELRGLHAGDLIAFEVKATDKESWIQSVHRLGSNDVAHIQSDPPANALLHVAQLKPGDLMPDVELLAENGRPIRLSDFGGQAVAFTFLFTRCPLPDFCPRMNLGFSKARDLLNQLSGGPTNWQFLSISFDPEFDSPGVLSRYAYSYRGQNADRWLFAAAPTNVMASITGLLDFRFTNEGGSFAHNLRTVVLDPQRRIYRQFNGNQWKPQELAQAMAEATQSARDLQAVRPTPYQPRQQSSAAAVEPRQP